LANKPIAPAKARKDLVETRVQVLGHVVAVETTRRAIDQGSLRLPTSTGFTPAAATATTAHPFERSGAGNR
jgi:hypothetical protein